MFRILGTFQAISAIVICAVLCGESPLFGRVNSQTGRAPAQTPGIDAVRLQSAAIISGTIRDAHGIALPGIEVTLVDKTNPVDRVTTTDSSGGFLFTGLAPGSYQVKTSSVGLLPWTSDELVLSADEKRELPIVATGLPTTTTTVQVVATLNEVAEAQVQQQEKQRILGFLPDFYNSYIWDAAPMTPKLKSKLALRSTMDPFAFVMAGGVAGVEQAHKTFPKYGQGSAGYAKRYGAAYADGMVARWMSSAVFPTILHQDPRYFYRGTGTVRSRVLYALATTVICRGDNGQREPNYSFVLGNFVAAGISNLYRSPGDRSAGLTFRNGLIITGSGAVTNLLREFLSQKLTSKAAVHPTSNP